MTVLAQSLRLGATVSRQAAGVAAQRTIARALDGTRWAVFPDSEGGSLQCLHSTDGGATWNPAKQSEIVAPVHNASLTIDEAGYADLVYQGEGEYLYYRKGAPIEGGWEWSVRVRIFDVPLLVSVNAVAHAEKDERRIHVVWSRGGEFCRAYYNTLKIDPEREIWLGTRETFAGPFPGIGHPAPSLDMNRETKDLWAAMWGGGLGLVVSQGRSIAGRWYWRRPEPLGWRSVEEGSVSGVWLGDAFAVTAGSDGKLVARTTAGVEAVAEGPAARTSAGVGAAATLHVLYGDRAAGPLFHRTLAGGSWSDAEEVHPGPVHSFSAEQHGGQSVGVLLVAGDAPPYSVEFLAVG